jgi:hypothetical protein
MNNDKTISVSAVLKCSGSLVNIENLEESRSPIRVISIILAYGVLRLQNRQKILDSLTEQRVHNLVLHPNGDTS